MSDATPVPSALAIVAVEAHDVACVRGGRGIFENIGFTAEAGQVLSVEGPNGAGKTSLLRIVAGLLRQTAGTIGIRTNTGAVEDREERGRLCGWLGHQDGVKAQLTARENARFWQALYRAPATLDDALERVGLARLADAPAQFLSAGQRRRLALVRLLLSGSPLWLLDEPLAALDAGGRSLVSELVREHCARGGIAIAATHEPLGVDAARVTLT